VTRALEVAGAISRSRNAGIWINASAISNYNVAKGPKGRLGYQA